MAREDTLLVWNVSGIGDFADSLPALAALRRARPSARIVLAVAEKTAPLARLCPSVDDVVGLPTRPGRGVPRLLDVPRWLATILPWRKRFGMVLDLYGAASPLGRLFTRGLLAWIAPEVSVGREAAARATLFTRGIPESELPADLMESYAKLVSRVPGDAERPEQKEAASPSPALQLPRNVLARVDGWLSAQSQFRGFDGPLVVVALGGDRPSRREFPERAERWLRLLQNEHRIRPVLWGTGRDPGVPAESGLVYADARGRWDLVHAAALISRAEVVITTQSSAQHLVSVWDVPTLVLVGPADPRKHRPHLSKSPLRLVQRHVPCAPCSYHDCPLTGDEYKRCLRGIDPEEVARAFRELGVERFVHE